MPDQKPKHAVVESPISDVFEGRHPSESEKLWAEKTLAPTLEKAPEKPIGAFTGTNKDESGHARFTTISGVPIRRLYTEADLPEDPRQAAVYDALAINEQVLDEVWTSPSVDVLKVVSSIVVNALDAYEDDPAEYADWVAVHRTGNCDCH